MENIEDQSCGPLLPAFFIPCLEVCLWKQFTPRPEGSLLRAVAVKRERGGICVPSCSQADLRFECPQRKGDTCDRC